MPNINFTAIKVDRGDQPIFVSGNIEDKQVIYPVDRWKNSAQFNKTMKIRFLQNLIPSSEGCFAIWIFFPELNECFTGDDMHVTIVSQFEILSKRG